MISAKEVTDLYDDVWDNFDQAMVEEAFQLLLTRIIRNNLPIDLFKDKTVLDMGCGSGEYGSRLLEWSHNRVQNYVGTDASPRDNWTVLKEKFTNFQFYEGNINNVLQHIPQGTNFFMSQSAVEHFPEDLSCFQQIRDYVISFKNPVLQVHLLPSSACLKNYLFHGVRQYTPRTVSKISKLFKDFSYMTLFKLGGGVQSFAL